MLLVAVEVVETKENPNYVHVMVETPEERGMPSLVRIRWQGEQGDMLCLVEIRWHVLGSEKLPEPLRLVRTR